MYQGIFKRQIRQAFEKLSAGHFDDVLRIFGQDIHFTFVGDHALSIDTHDKQAVQEWFVNWRRLFPTMQITPVKIVVSGPPWDVVATTQFEVTETLPDGSPYQNAGVQVVRIRFGKVVYDYLIEDTTLLQQALEIIDTHSHRRTSEALPSVHVSYSV
jgi:ketosteroid isomerase-like protein